MKAPFLSILTHYFSKAGASERIAFRCLSLLAHLSQHKTGVLIPTAHVSHTLHRNYVKPFIAITLSLPS